jgi:hypothetical protein
VRACVCWPISARHGPLSEWVELITTVLNVEYEHNDLGGLSYRLCGEDGTHLSAYENLGSGRVTAGPSSATSGRPATPQPLPTPGRPTPQAEDRRPPTLRPLPRRRAAGWDRDRRSIGLVSAPGDASSVAHRDC